MARRTYGQHCGIARGLELVGERWALLIVRELLLRPRRYTDLRESLQGIPTNILASRLREMEAAGVIYRKVLPRPASGVVYDLTSYGRELEDVLLRLWRWGVHSLPGPEEADRTPVDPSIRALQAAFRPERSRGKKADFEVWFGTFVAHVCVDDGILLAGNGPLEHADLIIDCRGSLTPILAGEVSPEEAIGAGRVWLTGDQSLFGSFVEIFRIPPGSAEGSEQDEEEA